jgi:5'-nucleotidase
LAAAKQAALLGSRGIAFSTTVSDNHEPDFSPLEPYVAKVLDLLIPNKTLSLVNVNLPEKPKGIRWTRQSVRHYDGKVVPDKDPMGRSIFWFTVTPYKAQQKAPTAGRSSIIGCRLPRYASISRMKQISLEL